MRKHGLLAAGLAVALAWASPAAADTIQFDTNGGAAGGVIGATTFDWAPGNSLIIENAAGTQAQILFQANLNVIQTGGLGYLNGSNGFWYTAVAEFDVALTPTGPNSSSYTIIPGSGVLRIYVDAERGDNLTGLGFAADAGAVEILMATISTGSGNFGFNVAVPPAPLDAFNSAEFTEPGGNNYPTVNTLTGAGGTELTATVQTFNAAYFLDLVAGSTLMFTNSSQIDPYNQANPSAQFSANTIADGGTLGATNPLLCGPGGAAACINGTGTVIIAQSDANSSFTQQNPIPEPATLTLLGLGLAGSAVARRRQKKAAK